MLKKVQFFSKKQIFFFKTYKYCTKFFIFYFTRDIQGVPRNMTVGEQFEMSSSMSFKLFDTKESNKKQYMTVLLQKVDYKVKYILVKDFLTK